MTIERHLSQEMCEQKIWRPKTGEFTFSAHAKVNSLGVGGWSTIADTSEVNEQLDFDIAGIAD